MRANYILEMLNDGKIEELKAFLQDEIYQKELTNTPGAKQRYTAMKRYFKYAGGNNKALSMPCVLENKTCFVDGFTAVRTSETCGDMEQYKNGVDGEYFKLDKMMGVEYTSGYDSEEIDVNVILAEAKSKGFKYKKSEVGQHNDFTMVFHYRNAFYKIGLLDQAFSIINDGNISTVYTNESKVSCMKIITSIGEMVLLPVNMDAAEGNKTVIEVVSKYNKSVA